MSVEAAYLFALATLVGAQIAMTWLYGWKGLAASTGAAIILIGGATVLYFFWVDAQFAGEWPRLVKTEKRLASVFFLLLPTLTVLIGAVVSAAFVKSE